MENTGQRRFLWLGVLVIILAVGWNYWLPTAENFFNLVTQANENRTKDLQNVDFYAYYNAGSRFSNGVNPYYWEISASQKQFSDYLYPPTLLPIYSLMARLSYNTARLLWLVLYFICYAAAAAALYSIIKKELRLVFLSLAALLTLCSFPLLNHIHNGQADVFIAGFTMLGLAAYVRGWKIPAAILFAFGTVMKVSPVFFLIFFVIFLKDWRFLIAFILAVLGFTLVTLPFVPAALYPDYILHVLPEVSKGTSYWINQSLLKYFSTYPLLAQGISLAGFVGFTGLAGWLRRHYSSKEGQNPLYYQLKYPLDRESFPALTVFFLNLLVVLVFAGKAWSMAYVWTILPVALILTCLFEMKASPYYLAPVGLGVFLLVSKVYGYPLLDSLNLWGSLLLIITLGIGLIKPNTVKAG